MTRHREIRGYPDQRNWTGLSRSYTEFAFAAT